MTLQQEAYKWIDKLPDDSVSIVIEIMMRMAPADGNRKSPSKSSDISTKMQAYRKMQELRKQTAAYTISESERAAALDEKYGILNWPEGSTD